jgi:ferredoxin
MKTRLYHFSGTGNSLWAARALAEHLGDTTLTPIVRAMAEGDTQPAEERVGIVCPVYMYRLPHIVVRFIDRLQTRAPVFVVATMGGSCGDLFVGVQRQFDRRHLDLSLGMTVCMVSNYAPFGAAPDEAGVAAALAPAPARVEEIAGLIERGERRVERDYRWFRAAVHPGLLYRLGHKFIPESDKAYHVDDGCDGCGICALVCPVDNLTMAGDRPTWGKRCEQCMACLQWCPQEVIQVKDKTQGQQRYRHPDILSKDIVAQKKPPRGER